MFACGGVLLLVADGDHLLRVPEAGAHEAQVAVAGRQAVLANRRNADGIAVESHRGARLGEGSQQSVARAGRRTHVRHGQLGGTSRSADAPLRRIGRQVGADGHHLSRSSESRLGGRRQMPWCRHSNVVRAERALDGQAADRLVVDGDQSVGHVRDDDERPVRGTD